MFHGQTLRDINFSKYQNRDIIPIFFYPKKDIQATKQKAHDSSSRTTATDHQDTTIRTQPSGHNHQDTTIRTQPSGTRQQHDTTIRTQPSGTRQQHDTNIMIGCTAHFTTFAPSGAGKNSFAPSGAGKNSFAPSGQGRTALPHRGREEQLCPIGAGKNSFAPSGQGRAESRSITRPCRGSHGQCAVASGDGW